MATASLNKRKRHYSATLAKGDFYCPKCQRKIATHISTRSVFCSQCSRAMKRLN